VPWFHAPQRATESVRIVFGHWATLGFLEEPSLLAIDTGCVWGQGLTGVRLDRGLRRVTIPATA
jgi:bis(5'-nucleosyl)-tetraphosphatase (symmetrical)